MTAQPYASAPVCCLLSDYLTSRRNERGYHLIFCLLIDLLGYNAMIIPSNVSTAVPYVDRCLCCCGKFSALSLLFSWLTSDIRVRGHTKKNESSWLRYEHR